MLRTDQPSRGSFDYMLRDVDKQVWRDAGLGNEPPTPTGGGGTRIRVEIEIIDQRARVIAERKARKHARALFWAIVFGLLWGFILLMPKGHAQTMSQYRLGGTTYYQGTTQDGQSWTGSSYRLGGTTYFKGSDQNGWTTNCSSYTLGSQTYTNCN